MLQTPQLRSWRHMKGLPGLNERQARLMKAGNSLLAWTCMIATVAWECQAFFSIENPMPSWAWASDEMMALWARVGVIMVTLTYDAYGMPWKKMTGVFTNLTYGHCLKVPETSWAPTVMLRGMICYEGENTFRTKLAQSYPTLFAERYAMVSEQSLLTRRLELQLDQEVTMADQAYDEEPFHVRY